MANYKFTPLTVQTKTIPKALKEMGNWLNWRLEERDGKWAKIPYRSDGKGRAKSNDSKTWTDFDSACVAYGNGKGFSGIGVALDGKGRLIGIDLDAMDNASAPVKKLYKLLLDAGAYIEISPSGTGVRAFVWGDMKTTGHNLNGVEIYRTGRYLTVTGRMVEGSGTDLIECQEAVDLAFQIMDIDNVERKAVTVKNDLGDFEGLLPLDPEREVVMAALLWVNPNVGEGEWFRIAQALWAWSSGSDEGLELFTKWSRCKSYKNPAADCRSKWRAMTKSGVSSINIGTVIRKAHENIEGIKKLPSEKRVAALRLVPMSPEKREGVAQVVKKVGGMKIAAARKLVNKEVVLAAVEPVTEVLPMNKPVRYLDKVFLHDHIRYNKDGVPVGLLQTSDNYRKLCEVYGIRGAWNELKRELTYDVQGKLEHTIDAVLCDLKSVAVLNGMANGDAMGYLKMIGRDGSYDPVRLYLDALTVQKGGALKRLAESVKLADESQRKLFNRVFRMWMIQGVAAAYRGKETPNEEAIAKYEHILIFSGAQGEGKSNFLHRLFYGVKDGFKDGHHLDPTNKDNVMQVTKFWGAELGEIDTTFRRSGISELKAFLSMLFDTYRVPYAISDISVLRSTSFCGSVNDSQFLLDLTGNRRMLPFEILSMLMPDKSLVDEAWAEAVEAYLSGEAWWPTKKLEKALDIHRQSAETLTPEIHALLAHFGSDFSKGEDWLNAREILHRTDPFTRISQVHTRAINLFLKTQGCKMKIIHRQKYWFMPDSLF